MAGLLRHIKQILEKRMTGNPIDRLSAELASLTQRYEKLQNQLNEFETNEIRYSRILASDISFYIIDLQGRVRHLNETSMKVLGLVNRPTLNINMREFFHPEHIAFNDKQFTKMLKVVCQSGRAPMTQLYFKGVKKDVLNAVITGYYIPEREEVIGTIIDRDDFSFSYAFSESFFQNMPIASVMVNANSRLVAQVSESFCHLTGNNKEEILGASLNNVKLFISEQEQQDFLTPIDQSKYLPTAEVNILTRTGELKHCIGSGFKMVMDAEPFFLFSLVDITPQKETEKELRLSRELNTTLVNTTRDMMTLIKPDGTVIEMNDITARTMDRTREEVIGKNLLSLFTSNTLEQRKENLKRVVETKQPFHHVDYDDSIDKTFDTIMYPIMDDEGEVIQLAIYSKDVSEQKRQEALLANLKELLGTIINSMPSILISLDQEKRVTNWNREAENVTGVKSEQATGQFIEAVFPMLTRFSNDINETIYSQTPQTLQKQSIYWKDETRFWTINMFPLNAVKTQGAAIRIDDVTQSVEMEQLLIQTEKMMTVGGLAAGMAHELNNPLAGIAQSLQNIKRRLDPDFAKNISVAEELGVDLKKYEAYLNARNIKTFIKAIDDSAKRAANIISNMLQFSRKSEKDKTYVDINQLVDGALDLIVNDYNIKKQIDSKKIRFTKVFQLDLPNILCVETEIQQVLLNLLKNASDALFDFKTQNPEITIHTRQEANNLVIEVSDNGPGIPEDKRQRIFEPFFTTKPVGKGTGLGLSVSYMIIHQNHGGMLQVGSKIDNGTIFTIYLPIPSQKAS